MTESRLLLLADAVLAVHVLIAAFNAFSLPVIWLGAWRGWRFVRNPWFRFSHVGLMGFVLAETVAGRLCPLTVWEGVLRRAGGQGWARQGQSFIGYWAGKLLFHDFSQLQFGVAYGLFFGLILLTLFLVPVRRRGKILPDMTKEEKP
ncbi:DUF2784 domain-containing protein [Pseudodesulfovibrio portus]|uniref:DUF2784 domain-containing protein n=1 Tax=Pseudodesulfovibrio portus TaxID=231439 RepID=A0ABN6RXD5_9BACT|nr:DUF2784 domain-containing protein [Pseudodesulfovibrio portus]BDQ34237.1 hypothetical protein JCM14722_17790 [Pseudodesulfovibrio portus]